MLITRTTDGLVSSGKLSRRTLRSANKSKPWYGAIPSKHLQAQNILVLIQFIRCNVLPLVNKIWFKILVIPKETMDFACHTVAYVNPVVNFKVDLSSGTYILEHSF